MKPPPPEEKLLRLIRGKDAPGHPLASPGRAADAATAVLPSRPRGSEISWPRLAIAGLGVVLLAEVVLLIVQASRPVPEISLPPPPAAPPVAAAPVAPSLALRSLAASAPATVFRAPAPSRTAEPAAASRPSTIAKDVAARLSVIGIVSDEPPQAIIEDSKTNKSYFVTAGQPVIEGAVVQEIQNNRVILDLDGETIDLSL